MAMLERRRPLWLPGLALALLLAGCGPSGAGGGQAGQAAADGHQGHDMEAMAVQPIELRGKAPRLALSATPDPMGGFNLRVMLANFRLAPERTGGRPVPGEGHLHLYVDGAKRTRLYASWFYLDGLSRGPHDLRVEAVASNHAPFHHGGEPVVATTAVQAG